MIMIVSSGVTTGRTTLVADYGGASSQDLVMSVSDTPVTVSSFSGPTFTSTLRGIINTATAYISVGATFSDGTQYTTLFTSGTPVLPGLVSFSSNVSAVATVDSRLAL